MTDNEKAIVIGCHRMGANIEQICFAMKIDGTIIERFIKDLEAKKEKT